MIPENLLNMIDRQHLCVAQQENQRVYLAESKLTLIETVSISQNLAMPTLLKI